eukprot:9479589-Pyramimonas_sp.AAC.2
MAMALVQEAKRTRTRAQLFEKVAQIMHKDQKAPAPISSPKETTAPVRQAAKEDHVEKPSKPEIEAAFRGDPAATDKLIRAGWKLSKVMSSTGVVKRSWSAPPYQVRNRPTVIRSPSCTRRPSLSPEKVFNDDEGSLTALETPC